MCSWGKNESDYVGMPTYVMWKRGVTVGKKGELGKVYFEFRKLFIENFGTSILRKIKYHGSNLKSIINSIQIQQKIGKS